MLQLFSSLCPHIDIFNLFEYCRLFALRDLFFLLHINIWNSLLTNVFQLILVYAHSTTIHVFYVNSCKNQLLCGIIVP